ncbi:hypothetical protein [Roseomonas rosulenta]|uniref:hypothetical protein n=1 Tax=Roseomonas rosulenta TaxID=2748667 RepID=UPI0018DF92A3|nr:hypothetical protein [Roseomonas rosulenta]
MPRLAILLVPPVPGACAARTRPGRSEGAPRVSRPAAPRGAWLIGGHMHTRRIPDGLGSTPRREAMVLLNGAEAMRAEMPRDRPAALKGRAEGSAIAAMCAPRMPARATVEATCLVMTDNERAASLVFTAGTRTAA